MNFYSFTREKLNLGIDLYVRELIERPCILYGIQEGGLGLVRIAHGGRVGEDGPTEGDGDGRDGARATATRWPRTRWGTLFGPVVSLILEGWSIRNAH